jgi:hypothetical protein
MGTNYRLAIMQALSLAVILVGLKAAFQTTDLLLVQYVAGHIHPACLVCSPEACRVLTLLRVGLNGHHAVEFVEKNNHHKGHSEAK